MRGTPLEYLARRMKQNSPLVLHPSKLYSDIWVCLKIVYPIVPNGFADHYPVFKWLFHWEYTQHFQTNPYIIKLFSLSVWVPLSPVSPFVAGFH